MSAKEENACGEYVLEDEEATADFAARLASIALAGDVIALEGPLGIGKTALARAFIRSRLELPSLPVPSPTFSLIQIYTPPLGPALWHVDLYRLTTVEEVWELGLEEAFCAAIALIEWPDRLGSLLPDTALRLSLTAETDRPDRRLLCWHGDARWRRRLWKSPLP